MVLNMSGGILEVKSGVSPEAQSGVAPKTEKIKKVILEVTCQYLIIFLYIMYIIYKMLNNKK